MKPVAMMGLAAAFALAVAACSGSDTGDATSEAPPDPAGRDVEGGASAPDSVPGEVVPECIDGARSWCFGTGWTETKEYAPTKAAAMISIADLQRILSALAP